MHKKHNRIPKNMINEIGSSKVNLAYLVFLLAFLLTSVSVASWEETKGWEGKFENAALDGSMKSIEIYANQVGWSFQIDIWFRSHRRESREGFKTAEELRAFLRDGHFNVRFPSAGLEDVVSVEVPTTNPQRAKELIDGLNQFEPILPLSMVDKMKLAFGEALQRLHRCISNDPVMQSLKLCSDSLQERFPDFNY